MCKVASVLLRCLLNCCDWCPYMLGVGLGIFGNVWFEWNFQLLASARVVFLLVSCSLRTGSPWCAYMSSAFKKYAITPPVLCKDKIRKYGLYNFLKLSQLLRLVKYRRRRTLEKENDAIFSFVAVRVKFETYLFWILGLIIIVLIISIYRGIVVSCAQKWLARFLSTTLWRRYALRR